MRLIDADAFREALVEHYRPRDPKQNATMDEVCMMLDRQPTMACEAGYANCPLMKFEQAAREAGREAHMPASYSDKERQEAEVRKAFEARFISATQ